MQESKDKKIFLFDGNAFCYRAFYAITNLTASDGTPTNAVYGFYTMIRRILETESPEYCAFCFDVKAETHRKKRFADYKAHRKPMPEELSVQIPVIKELIKALKIPIFEKAGYEADDLFGTLAKELSMQGMNVYIATGDKDALQLVNEKVKVYSSYRDKVKIYDIEEVKRKYGGLGPDKVTDLLGLMGDSADNIPGVPGVGEKTAISLLNEYGSIDGLYENIDQLKKSARKTKIIENEENARLSKELATIECDVDFEYSIQDMQLKSPDKEMLAGLFRKLEFGSLLREIETEKQEEDREYVLLTDENALRDLVTRLQEAETFAFDTETNSVDAHTAALVGMSFSFEKKKAYYIPVQAPDIRTETGLDRDAVLSLFKEILEDPQKKKIGQNIKYDVLVLKKYGINVKGIYFDTMIAAYLDNPARMNRNLDEISLTYLGVKKIAYTDVVGSGRTKTTIDEADIEKVRDYACEDADCTYRLYLILRKNLADKGLSSLFEEIEMPLVEVLIEMETAGVYVDSELLKALSDKTAEKMDFLTKNIFKEAGEEFNVNSTKQLAVILFEKLQLPVIKKTKTGASTNVAVLEKLSEEHELPKLILEYRELAKLKSTYLDAIPALINKKSGMVHTSFNQAATATGRLSSSSPNLQNIPIRTEIGREIRKAFKPRAEGRKILAADYSQVELRLLAHFSEDPILCKAFNENEDIHTYTATILHDVEASEVSYEMRRIAKIVNFSIIYGKTPFGLSQELGIGVKEAKFFIDQYFLRYAKIGEYLENVKETAHEKGYVETILGRRIMVPEINSSNKMRRQFAERAAMNGPLQGSSADLIKKAMIEINAELEDKEIDAKMILQVHDELVFDVADDYLAELESIVVSKMEKAIELKVPLKVDAVSGKSWYK